MNSANRIDSAYHDAAMPSVTDRMTRLLTLLEADPNDAFCLYSLAQEHAGRGNHATAIEYYDRTINSDRDYVYAYFHKARSQQALGDRPGAAMTLREGLARARVIGDPKAASELDAYLDELA